MLLSLNHLSGIFLSNPDCFCQNLGCSFTARLRAFLRAFKAGNSRCHSSEHIKEDNSDHALLQAPYFKPCRTQLCFTLLSPLKCQRTMTPHMRPILVGLFWLWQDCPDKKKISFRYQDSLPYSSTCLSSTVSSLSQFTSCPVLSVSVWTTALEKKARLSLEEFKT